MTEPNGKSNKRKATFFEFTFLIFLVFFSPRAEMLKMKAQYRPAKTE